MRLSEREIRLLIREAVRSRSGLLLEADRMVQGEQGVYVYRRDDDTMYLKNQSQKTIKAVAQSANGKGFQALASPTADAPLERDESVEIPESARVVRFQFDDAVSSDQFVQIDVGPSSTQAPAAPNAASSPAPASEPKQEPQAAAMGPSIQDKIKSGALAVSRSFSDKDSVTFEDVTSAMPVDTSNAKWIKNEEASTHGLREWDAPSDRDTMYDYCALIRTDDKGDKAEDILAFVVLADENADRHMSAGQILSIDSPRYPNRAGFCVLYKRAMGKDHPQCGSIGGRGGRGSGGGKADGAGGRSRSSGPGEGPGAIEMRMKDGQAVRGSGDAGEGLAGVGTRRLEKLRKGGRKIITKPKRRNQGFYDFPAGPENTFRHRNEADGRGPTSIAVEFEHPVETIVDSSGMNSRVGFGENRDSSNIKVVRIGFSMLGTFRGDFARLLGADAETIMPGEDGFEDVVKWIYANPKEFDLAPDEFEVRKRENEGDKGVTRVGRSGGLAESSTPRFIFDRFLV